MTPARLRRSLGWILAAGLLAAPAALSAEPDLTVTPIARDGEVLVSFELAGGITPELRDAIQSGLPTSFSYEIALVKGTGWYDRTIAAVTITASVRFDNLTRRYQLSRAVDGRVEDARPTEDEQAVRQWMTRFDRVPVSATAALEANGEYRVRIRALARPRSSWFAWPWDSGSVLGDATFTFLP